LGGCLTRKHRILGCIVACAAFSLLFSSVVSASDNSTILDRLVALQADVDRISDMVSLLSVSSTQNIAGEIDNLRAKIDSLQDQVTVLHRAIGDISGAAPSVADSVVSIEAKLADLSKKVDSLKPASSSWNQSQYPWGQGGITQMGMLSMSMSPKKPKRGEYFTIMVYDVTTGQPAAGAMVQGPGLLMMNMGAGAMIPMIGGGMPSFGFAIADGYGIVYGRWEGGRASYTARSQDGKFGSLTVGSSGSVVAWVLAIVISLALIFSGLYVYYRRQLGFGGMSV